MGDLQRIEREPQNLSDKAYLRIKQAILEGVLSPGSRLVEKDLAEELGISRSPVREALQRLTLEGLVEKEDSTTRVCKISSDRAREIYDLRECLEKHALRKGGISVSPSQYSRLRDICEQMMERIENKELGELPELNENFHLTLIQPAGNEMLNGVMRMLFDKIRVYHAFAVGTREDQEASVRDHFRIVDALEANKVDRALEIVEEHYQRARDVYLFQRSS